MWERPSSFKMPGNDLQPENWFTPCSMEQYAMFEPISGSSAFMIVAYVRAYQATHKTLYLAKAESLANALTEAQQFHRGRFPTRMVTQDRAYWVNSTVNTIRSLSLLAAASQAPWAQQPRHNEIALPRTNGSYSLVMRSPINLVLVCMLVAASATAAVQNQLANPGFENLAESNLPVQWEPLIIGAPVTFAMDPSDLHSGARSLRITAAETTRAYIRSDPIPVAPGEKFRFSVWVKHQNVPAGKGTVIAIAEFTNAQDLSPAVAKLGVADTSKPWSEWRKLESTTAVPESGAFLRLRLGFSYSQGSCWWDDASVQFEKPLVARLDLATARLSPAAGAAPGRPP